MGESAQTTEIPASRVNVLLDMKGNDVKLKVRLAIPALYLFGVVIA
jgi:hypothetical protein